MKKITLFLFACIVSFASVAQNTAVNKANWYHQDGDLKQAKENIDLAVNHEKTKEKGKTWYTKGLIYGAIYASTDPKVKELAPNALNEAIEALNKALTMEKPNSTYWTQANDELKTLWNFTINEGATAYQAGEYPKAVIAFENASKVNPNDTTAYIYGGYAALQDKQNEKALTNFYRLVELDYHNVEIYKLLISLEKFHNKSNEKALEITKKARAKFPSNAEIMKEEIALLQALGKVDEAMVNLKKAIEVEPNNAVNYLSMGNLYQGLEDLENAVINYEKALELKPDFFEAAFNLGVMYYNQAALLLKTTDDMDPRTYAREGKKVEEKAKELFKKSIPGFEAARRIKPEDSDVLRSLMVAYSKNNMKDKVAEINKTLDKLEGK